MSKPPPVNAGIDLPQFVKDKFEAFLE